MHIPRLVETWLTLCLVTVATVVGAQEKAPQPRVVKLSDLSRWVEFARPKPEELGWQQIPWRQQYWQALIEAQQKRQPVLLWAMNGHPLGCT